MTPNFRYTKYFKFSSDFVIPILYVGELCSKIVSFSVVNIFGADSKLVQ